MLSIWRLEHEINQHDEPRAVPYAVLLWPIFLYDLCFAIPRALYLLMDYASGYAVSAVVFLLFARAVLRWFAALCLLGGKSVTGIAIGVLISLQLYQVTFFGFSADMLADAVLFLVIWSSPAAGEALVSREQIGDEQVPAIECAPTRTVEATLESRPTAA